MSALDDLAARLDRIESQLRGDINTDPIDMKALPLAALQNHLENDWWPQARELVEPHSIQAEQIGVLPGARIKRDNAYGFGVGAVVEIPMELADYDNSGMWNAAVTSQLVCRVQGKYSCKANATVTLTAPGVFSVGIYYRPIQGGGPFSIAEQSQDVPAGGAAAHVQNCGTIIHLNEGDIISMYGFYSAGVTTFTAGGNNNETHLEAQWVGL